MYDNYIESLKLILNNTDNLTLKKLRSDMSTYQKNLFDKLCTDNEMIKDYSLNDLIFDFDSNFVQKFLELELEHFINYCKDNNIENKRNGYTQDITLTLADKTISFNRPRARHEADFNSIFIPKKTRIIKDLNDNIIYLYSLNNSVNNIKDMLINLFNIKVSTCYISETIQSIAEEIFNWRNRDLKKCYFTINIDCMYINIRDNKNLASHKIPVYIAVGTTLSGNKEIVGMYLGNEDCNKNIIDKFAMQDISESKAFWLEVFADFKDRGIEKILYLVSDGVVGMEDAIKEEYPDVFYQRCVVHLARNLAKYTTIKDRKTILQDFKKIYTAPNKEIALLMVEEFRNKYSSKKAMLKHANNYIDLIMPLFNVPINIRKYIYTNNIVESVNSKVQRGFYGRGALPNSQAAINIIYFNLRDLENKWAKTKINNWNNIFKELAIIHANDLKKYSI